MSNFGSDRQVRYRSSPSIQLNLLSEGLFEHNVNLEDLQQDQRDEVVSSQDKLRAEPRESRILYADPKHDLVEGGEAGLSEEDVL